jgi:hypothetical protein
VVGGVEELAPFALSVSARSISRPGPARTVLSFSAGLPRRKGRRRWIHLAKVFRCAAMRAIVRSE